jgi:hypothetical protein
MGAVLGQRTFDLEADDDRTLVLTAKAPRILVFDDAGMGVVPSAATVYYAFRHAADLGPLTWKAGLLFPVPPSPAADAVWEKGDQEVGIDSSDAPFAFAITRPDGLRPLATITTIFGATDGAIRQEYYALGTKPKNAKIVEIRRRVQD